MRFEYMDCYLRFCTVDLSTCWFLTRFSLIGDSRVYRSFLFDDVEHALFIGHRYAEATLWGTRRDVFFDNGPDGCVVHECLVGT